jgi:hypothetical protein
MFRRPGLSAISHKTTTNPGEIAGKSLGRSRPGSGDHDDSKSGQINLSALLLTASPHLMVELRSYIVVFSSVSMKYMNNFLQAINRNSGHE